MFPKLPLVDISKGWITNALPARLRKSGQGRPRVLYNNAAIGKLAAQHFIEHGFRNIAFLNYGNFWMETERRPSFQREVESAKARYLEIPYYKVTRAPTQTPQEYEHTRFNWLVKAIRELPKPVGIFAGTDDQAARLLYACETAGANVPESVAVLGCNNDTIVCENSLVPLSSVDNNLESLGYEAAMLLDKILSGMSAPKTPIVVPPKGVIQRQSTNILAVPDPRIARAIQFIDDHYHEPIGTIEVAAAAGLSRRMLEYGFQRHIRKSVAHAILARRMERAKHLLIETSIKLQEVAAKVGFCAFSHFSRVFHRATGTTPSHFRRQCQTGERRMKGV
jgi:LacI family transcriptional regulator